MKKTSRGTTDILPIYLQKFMNNYENEKKKPNIELYF